ncbi:protein of unknown function [Cupriavidus taiwanensis]|nr:protein of unknown function [Cupriavidus taiwanensis]
MMPGRFSVAISQPVRCHSGMLVPAGTPPQIVQKLHSVTQGLLADSKAKTALGQQGDVVMIDPATFAKRVAREEGNWTAVIQREAITLD